MDISTAPSYRGYRFPAEIISHCVWLYLRFCLSFRDVQEMMLERGIQVSHEAIRRRTLKFGAQYARRLRRRIGRYGEMWRLDEVFCKVNGEQVYLWRAVDQDGETLDAWPRSGEPPTQRTLLSKVAEGIASGPRAIVTDKLSSDATARAELMPASNTEWADGSTIEAKLPSTHTGAGATNAALQVHWARTAFPFGAWISVEPVLPLRHRLRACH